MQNNYTLLWRTLKHNAAQQQKTTSSYAHSSEAKTGEKTAPPRRRSMRKDLRAFFSFFVRSFATQTSFCTGCNETKKKTKYAKCFIQHEMEHNNSSSSSPVSTHWIYYYYEFIFVCDSFQPTKRTHSFLLPSFRSPVISIYTRLAVRSTHAKAI